MILLDRAAVERLLTFPLCIAALRRAMIAVSAGEAALPLRQFMAVPGRPGKLGLMPGALADPPCFGVKIVSKFLRPPGSPHGTHVGAMLLFEAEHGLPVALIEGGSLTAIRTAAMTALATDLLAAPGASRLLICGAGEQALWHLRAFRATRALDAVTVWTRDPAKAAAFAAAHNVAAVANLERAVADADIVCTTTSAAEPFLQGRWLRPGQHINLVGSAIPETAEADVETVARSRYFVDYRPAALVQAGELKRAIATGAVGEDHIVAEIGAVAARTLAGRSSSAEITLYKSLGVAAQDLAAATALVEAASAAGEGVEFALE